MYKILSLIINVFGPIGFGRGKVEMKYNWCGVALEILKAIMHEAVRHSSLLNSAPRYIIHTQWCLGRWLMLYT